jgi:acylphosphatase
MRTVTVVVRGRVQGVFFRASTARRAEKLGLSGSVRNRPDGAVEAVLQGDDGAVDRMVEWCRTGPDLADVRSVEVSEQPGAPEEHGFRVS